jgi:hypothetical protein
VHDFKRAVAIISRRKEAFERINTLYKGELSSSGEHGTQPFCFMNKCWRVNQPDSSIDLARKAHHHLYTLLQRRIARARDFVGIAYAEEE